jgi:hypothetical protein
MVAMEKVGDSNILWVSLDHAAVPKSAVYFQGRHYYKFKLEKREMRLFLTASANFGVPLDTLVDDGINQHVSEELIEDSTAWIDNEQGNRKAIFSSSSKVKEMRSHENTMVIYFTMHSWLLEEFQRACVKDGQPTRIYHQSSEVISRMINTPK